ncbi:MAG: transcription-repair coupling factor, partial [Bacteroidetes bacterium]|nr:transcription-repair coupling factor [Bacteroidota bacterium]
MTKEEILRKYNDNENNSLLIQELKGNGVRVHLKNVVGSSLAFISAALHQNIYKTNLFIVNDKEEAAYLLNDLENLLGEENVLFFPASYRMPYEHEEIDNANILLRAEVLNKLNIAAPADKTVSRSKHVCIVTYPEALTEKVVTKALLTKNTLQIRQGEKISIDFITEVLNEYEFDRVDYVIEPGQFSVRGGIVDIFSFSNDHPYRVEFLGNDVDSIRSFDPTSQLSISKLMFCTIIPNVQTKLLQESRQSFLEFIPNDSILWFQNFQLSAEKIEKAYAQAEEAFSKLDGIIAQLPPSELYIDKDNFSRQALSFSTVEYTSQVSFKSNITVTYNLSPQPSFNKNFGLLNENLQNLKRQKFEIIIFADTHKQIERLYKIFEDINPQKVSDKGEGKELPFGGVGASFHEGFIDHDLKLVCYTDHQIFDRYHRFRLKNSFNKKNEALTLKELKGLNPGDYVTHIDYGVGRYGGLETIEVNGKQQETIRLVYKDYDVVNISIHSLHRIAKYSGKEGTEPK